MGKISNSLNRVSVRTNHRHEDRVLLRGREGREEGAGEWGRRRRGTRVRHKAATELDPTNEVVTGRPGRRSETGQAEDNGGRFSRLRPALPTLVILTPLVRPPIPDPPPRPDCWSENGLFVCSSSTNTSGRGVCRSCFYDIRPLDESPSALQHSVGE